MHLGDHIYKLGWWRKGTPALKQVISQRNLFGKKLYVEHKMLVSVIHKEFPQTDKETIQREKEQRVENEKLNRNNPKR